MQLLLGPFLNTLTHLNLRVTEYPGTIFSLQTTSRKSTVCTDTKSQFSHYSGIHHRWWITSWTTTRTSRILYRQNVGIQWTRCCTGCSWLPVILYGFIWWKWSIEDVWTTKILKHTRKHQGCIIKWFRHTLFSMCRKL